MRLSALKHLVEATHSLSRCERIHVLGSSALLASFPELGEAGQPLEVSFDADLLVEPCDDRLAAMLHEAVGEGSLFAQRTGYHADFLRQNIIETLPNGWPRRAVKLEVEIDARALAPADIAAVKLRIGRTKDLELCRQLVSRGLVPPEMIRESIKEMVLNEAEIVRAHRNLAEIAA